MENIMFYDSLREIAEAVGDSNYNPVSVSLLCLGHGITFDEKGRIMAEFNQVLQNTAFEDLKVEQFREAMKKVVPRSEEFADSVIIAFIKAYARNLIAELVPYARTLD